MNSGSSACEVNPHPLDIDTGSGRLDDVNPTDDHPLVTAVVTTYDRPELVKRAISSVRGQTYAPLECIVIEDGTDSGVAEWLQKEDHGRIRYVRHKDNQGLAGARNTALALAKGTYIAYLDDDDAWKPDRVKRQVSLIRSLSEAERRILGVVYCGLESRKNGKVQSILHPENSGNLAASIREKGASTVQSACLFPRTTLLDINGYDENLPSSIDHDIWMSLAVAGYEAQTIEDPLVISFDDFEDSMMTNTAQRIQGVKMYINKWHPTYRGWFGPKEGEQYAQRYFIQVVGRLAATKLVTGQFGEAKSAFDAIFDVVDPQQYGYVIHRCIVLIAESGAKRSLPPSAVRYAARLIK